MVLGGVVVAAELGELPGRLRAALYVADVEPLPADRPEWLLPNVLITPHVGGDTYAFARLAPGLWLSKLLATLRPPAAEYRQSSIRLISMSVAR